MPEGYEDITVKGKLFINIIQAARLIKSDLMGKSDPYAEFTIDRLVT